MDNSRYEILKEMRRAQEGLKEAGKSERAEKLGEAIESFSKADDSVMQDKGFLKSLGDFIYNLWQWCWATLKKCFQWVAEILKYTFRTITSILEGLGECFHVA